MEGLKNVLVLPLRRTHLKEKLASGQVDRTTQDKVEELIRNIFERSSLQSAAHTPSQAQTGSVDPEILEDIWKRVVNLSASLYRDDIRPLLLYIKETHHFTKPQEAVDFLLLRPDSLAKVLALEICRKYTEDKLLRK
jgi:hypothetical protein